MRDRIAAFESGILTYGITPPKLSYTAEKRREVAARQTQRIRSLPIDALVVYDLQDESMRTTEARPYPFLSCVDPAEYAFSDLSDVEVPKVVYTCVATKSRSQLEQALQKVTDFGGLSVLVGAASRQQVPALSLSAAQGLARSSYPELPLGGVLIAERHELSLSEDERVIKKWASGCRFFISQAVYSVTPTKNLLSDLAYRCQALGQPVPPILLTLSPCGSLKTLDFMHWLGISVPRWLQNDLRHSQDILQTSIDVCVEVFTDLWQFSQRLGIPLGCNVESVSLAKAEIDASVQLLSRVANVLGRR